MNNTITASRQNCILRCPRQHFFSYELGLRRDSISGFALRFGSAWHRAVEYRWLGATYDEALIYAIPEGVDMDLLGCNTLAAILAGYYDHYGPLETVGQLCPEEEFEQPIGHGWTAMGKIDGLGRMMDGRSCIIESKTTGDSLLPTSDYWLRLRFNIQLYQYYCAATDAGWDISTVIYDVVRKPSIKPKLVGKGKDKHKESVEEYCDRLWKDTVARPEFYFCRKDAPILQSDVDQFISQREAIIGLIEHYRKSEKEDRQEAWPRNVSCDTCDFCEYKSFCLSNITINPDNLPSGFSIGVINPELSHDTAENIIEAAS